MRELVRSNDPVLLSWLEAGLAAEGIGHVVLDGNISVLEGSIGAIPRRVMVADADFARAQAVLDAGAADPATRQG